MQFVKGVLLHKKQFTTKKGNQIPVVSVLDENKTFSQVIDITDFDNYVNGAALGDVVVLPVRVKAVTSDKGNSYINYVVAGEPLNSKSASDHGIPF